MLFLFLFITVAEAQLAYPAPDAGISGSAIPYFTGLKKLTIYRNVDDKWEGRPPFAYIKADSFYFEGDLICTMIPTEKYPNSSCREQFQLQEYSLGEVSLWLPYYDKQMIAGQYWYKIKLALDTPGWVSEYELPKAQSLVDKIKYSHHLVFTRSLDEILIYQNVTQTPTPLTDFPGPMCHWHTLRDEFGKVNRLYIDSIVQYKQELYAYIDFDVYVCHRRDELKRVTGFGLIKLYGPDKRLNIWQNWAGE